MPSDCDDDPLCDQVGKCKAPFGARKITNCIHCGKELREKDGRWLTHDAERYANPETQGFAGTL